MALSTIFTDPLAGSTLLSAYNGGSGSFIPSVRSAAMLISVPTNNPMYYNGTTEGIRVGLPIKDFDTGIGLFRLEAVSPWYTRSGNTVCLNGISVWHAGEFKNSYLITYDNINGQYSLRRHVAAGPTTVASSVSGLGGAATADRKFLLYWNNDPETSFTTAEGGGITIDPFEIAAFYDHVGSGWTYLGKESLALAPIFDFGIMGYTDQGGGTGGASMDYNEVELQSDTRQIAPTVAPEDADRFNFKADDADSSKPGDTSRKLWVGFESTLKAFADSAGAKKLFFRQARIRPETFLTQVNVAGMLDVGASEIDKRIDMGDVSIGHFIFMQSDQDIIVEMMNPEEDGHPADSDLVAHYKLDELSSGNATDSGGDSLTLTEGSEACDPVPGMHANAREFGGLAGASGHALTRAATSQFEALQSFTIALWVYVIDNTADHSAGDVLQYEQDAGSQPSWKLHCQTTFKVQLAFSVAFSDNAATLREIVSIYNLPNGWHHVVCIHDGTNMVLWIDGQPAAMKAVADFAGPPSGTVDYSSPHPTAGPFGLGAQPSTLANRWKGYIDDVAIYSSAKSAAWIAQYSGLGAWGGRQELPLKVRVTGQKAAWAMMTRFKGLSVSGDGTAARVRYFITGI